MCEEVREPSTQVPKAMVGTVILNLVAGFFFLVPLVYVLPDLSELVLAAQPVPVILASAVGNQGGAFALTIPLIILGIFCGIGCTTAASRCTWAFSRDGAIPGSTWWKQVNPTLGLPLNAMMLSMVVQIALGCIYFGSVAAYNAFSGVGVIFLTVSYGIPVAVSLLDGRSHIKDAPFNMGVFGLVCNVVTVGKSYSTRPFPHPSLPQSAADQSESMESARCTSLLHAYHHPRHANNHELCFCRLCRLWCHRHDLVLHLGSQELRGSPSRRRRDDIRPSPIFRLGLSPNFHVFVEEEVNTSLPLVNIYFISYPGDFWSGERKRLAMSSPAFFCKYLIPLFYCNEDSDFLLKSRPYSLLSRLSSEIKDSLLFARLPPAALQGHHCVEPVFMVGFPMSHVVRLQRNPVVSVHVLYLQ